MKYNIERMFTIGSLKRIVRFCQENPNVTALAVDNPRRSVDNSFFQYICREIYMSYHRIEDKIMLSNGSKIQYITFDHLADYISSHRDERIGFINCHSDYTEDEIIYVMESSMPVADVGSDELMDILGCMV